PHAPDGVHGAVADHQVAHLDGRPAHAHSPTGWVARRATANRMTSAMATASVWRTAMAAVSSELVENHASTMAGVMTFAFGPIKRMDAPSSRTLAMKSRSHAATRPGLSSGKLTG